jgi:DNA-directed RNA polymerase subunit RPC12/RpoP
MTYRCMECGTPVGAGRHFYSDEHWELWMETGRGTRIPGSSILEVEMGHVNGEQRKPKLWGGIRDEHHA